MLLFWSRYWLLTGFRIWYNRSASLLMVRC
jgi:hypothetical protein